MTRRLVVALLAGALLAAAPLARAAEFPGFSSPVVDAAGVVPVQVEQRLNAALADFQARRGIQIAVAVVETTGGRPIEDYSIDLAREWGVGDAQRDDGVVLVVAIADRTVRIEVGDGLEGELTDLESGRIIREHLVPRLRAGDVAGAIEAGTVEIRRALGDEVAAAPPASVVPTGEERPSDGGIPLGLAVFGALALLSLLGGAGNRRRNRRWGLGGPIVWGGGWGGGGFGGGGFGGGGFGGGGGGGFSGGGASGRW